MKKSWFKNLIHYEFAKCLQEANPRQSLINVFNDFLELSFLSITACVDKFQYLEVDKHKEDRYQQLIHQYKNPKLLSKALSCVVEGLEKESHDFIGDVFEALEYGDTRHLGQCFTPYNISLLNARLILGDVKPSEKIKIQEPACGSGGMIIAASHVLRENGVPNHKFIFHAVDIDFRCVCMTYLQTSLLDIPTIIYHGNTLTLDDMRSYKNPSSIMWHPCSV